MASRRVRINGVDRIDPRHTRAWRKLRDQVVREEPVCRLQFPGCTGASTTAAHLKAVALSPELAMSRSNVVGACKACNEAAGTLPPESLRYGSAPTPDALRIFD